MNWQPIETAPKNGENIIVLFNSASVPIVRLCSWDDGSPQPWADDPDSPRPDDIGWWSYRHSVTCEQIDMRPVGWIPCPDYGDLMGWTKPVSEKAAPSLGKESF
jgi:hypothetical protein